MVAMLRGSVCEERAEHVFGLAVDVSNGGELDDTTERAEIDVDVRLEGRALNMHPEWWR
jgi:hypothetical protein